MPQVDVDCGSIAVPTPRSFPSTPPSSSPSLIDQFRAELSKFRGEDWDVSALNAAALYRRMSEMRLQMRGLGMGSGVGSMERALEDGEEASIHRSFLSSFNVEMERVKAFIAVKTASCRGQVARWTKGASMLPRLSDRSGDVHPMPPTASSSLQIKSEAALHSPHVASLLSILRSVDDLRRFILFTAMVHGHLLSSYEAIATSIPASMIRLYDCFLMLAQLRRTDLSDVEGLRGMVHGLIALLDEVAYPSSPHSDAPRRQHSGLQCEACHQPVDASPVTLSCVHVYCFTCMLGVIAQRGGQCWSCGNRPLSMAEMRVDSVRWLLPALPLHFLSPHGDVDSKPLPGLLSRFPPPRLNVNAESMLHTQGGVDETGTEAVAPARASPKSATRKRKTPPLTPHTAFSFTPLSTSSAGSFPSSDASSPASTRAISGSGISSLSPSHSPPSCLIVPRGVPFHGEVDVAPVKALSVMEGDSPLHRFFRDSSMQGRSSSVSASSPQSNLSFPTSCHQCKSTKRWEELRCCSSKAEYSMGRLRKCRKKYCQACLSRNYAREFTHFTTHWKCPSCMDVCLCASCVRRREEMKAVRTQQQGTTAGPEDSALPINDSTFSVPDHAGVEMERECPPVSGEAEALSAVQKRLRRSEEDEEDTELQSLALQPRLASSHSFASTASPPTSPHAGSASHHAAGVPSPRWVVAAAPAAVTEPKLKREMGSWRGPEDEGGPTMEALTLNAEVDKTATATSDQGESPSIARTSSITSSGPQWITEGGSAEPTVSYSSFSLPQQPWRAGFASLSGVGAGAGMDDFSRPLRRGLMDSDFPLHALPPLTARRPPAAISPTPQTFHFGWKWRPGRYTDCAACRD